MGRDVLRYIALSCDYFENNMSRNIGTMFRNGLNYRSWIISPTTFLFMMMIM